MKNVAELVEISMRMRVQVSAATAVEVTVDVRVPPEAVFIIQLSEVDLSYSKYIPLFISFVPVKISPKPNLYTYELETPESVSMLIPASNTTFAAPKYIPVVIFLRSPKVSMASVSEYAAQPITFDELVGKANELVTVPVETRIHG